MRNEWQTYALTDLYSVSSGLSKPAKDFGEGHPFVSFKDVFYNFFLPDELSQLVKSSEKEQEKCSVRRGDVFLTRTSETMEDLGMSCVARKDYPKATFNGFSKRLRPSTELPIHPEYVGYYLRTPQFRNEMLAFSTMSTRASLNNDMIGRLQITLPPLPEQKAIAHILGTLDDKIELNRRMNATLEGMAQALFKSWFVDFDPVIDNALAAGNPIPDELAPRAEVRKNALASSGEPSRTNGITQQGSADYPTLSEPKSLFPAAFQFTEELGWIPEGWESTALSELLDVKYGKDHKKLADGKFPVYGSGGLMRHAESALFKGESVLIPRKGTLSNILYLNDEFWTVDTMFYTIPKMGSVAKFCYYHLKGLDFSSMNVGSAVPSMTTKVLNNLRILKPSSNVLEHFDILIAAYFTKSEQNNQESQTLTKLRDTLLPKLISGELRLSEAETLSQEVTS